MKDGSQEVSSKDELDIRSLIERWAKAVREQDIAGIRADHDSEVLMFDVPPPNVYDGTGCLHVDLGEVFCLVRKASRL